MRKALRSIAAAENGAGLVTQIVNYSDPPTLLDRLSHNTTGKRLKERIKDIDPTQPRRKEEGERHSSQPGIKEVDQDTHERAQRQITSVVPVNVLPKKLARIASKALDHK
ncbi:hypothetical protein H4Q26_011550 [Puccinia striiformis f. sp. tritici PST-130]|nr:hypothetical protein H4Q26_011550 [Puccinia striiformis f. sp. tritici PST-130]